ncbi:MAG TPA: DUF2062 domain-containing protein [Verrucomicrobiae bacterium]|nr:DUF2062 domain-containing protein [Verrucomicrobiae bacterium]
MKKFDFNLHRWLHEHSLKLLAIRDTPQAIAGGVAIGVFFGFTPLLGLKTLSAIFFAWITGSNILAAVIAGTLHDVIFPFMPLIYRWEYTIGYWILSHPHELPPPITHFQWRGLSWWRWTTFFSVGKPLLVGGSVCAAPFALISFLLTRQIVARHQRKKATQTPPPDHPPNPS